MPKSNLRLITLGRLAVLHEGQNITVQLPQKVRALLIYGARMRRPLSREVLADLFWQGNSVESASRSLRVALVPLRKALDPFLEVTRDQFQVIDASLDTDDFEAQVHMAMHADTAPAEQVTQLESAVRLYEGDFLTEFSIPDSSLFEAWAGAEREALRSTFIEAGGQLLDAYTTTRQFAAGLALEARLSAADPLNEKTHRRIMRFYAANGERTAALRVYERGQSLLWEELGVEPEDETIHLYEQIAASARTGAIPVALNTAAQADPPDEPITSPVRSNLPGQITPLFGREIEIESILAQLETARLVTVTGAGGVGKTRLVLATAQRAVEMGFFAEGGLYFVPLESLRHAEGVGSAIGRALGITETADSTSVESITARLGEKDALIILDNFEHVLDATLLIDALLRSTVRLHILVTSREPLSLYGEYRYDVPALNEADAAALFVDRARAVAPRLRVDDAALEQIDAICTRLEFQPLAIELAASRAGALSLQRIHAMLDQPLRLLATPFRGVPERQRTLYKTIAWSYDLLSSEEQALFRGLSVFAGGFNAESVREVCGARADWLDSLCDKHLIRRETHFHDAPVEGVRYTFLEAIRQYAAEALQAAGEWTSVADAHSAYFLRFAEHADLAARERDADQLRSRMDADLSNLHLALDRAADDPDGAEIECRLVIAMSEFWYRRGYFYQAREYSQRALRLREHIPSVLLAGVLAALGLAAHGLGDMGLADMSQNQAFDLYQAAGDRYGIAYVRFCQSIRIPDVKYALALGEEGLHIARHLDENQLIGLLCVSTGNAMTMLGELERATTRFVEATVRLQNVDQYATAFAHIGLAFARMERGTFQPALEEFHYALNILFNTRSPMASLVWAELGDLYFVLGQYDEAWQCYRKGTKLATEMQDFRRLRRLQRVGATLAWVRQDWTMMRGLYQSAFTGVNAASIAIGDLSQLLVGAGHIAYLLAVSGQRTQAAILHHATFHLLANRQSQIIYLLRQFRAQTEPLLDALPEEAGQRAWEAAHKVHPEQFFTFVLDCLNALQDQSFGSEKDHDARTSPISFPYTETLP